MQVSIVQISPLGSVEWGNCLRYLKKGVETEKGGNKYLTKRGEGGKLGQGVGASKRGDGGWNPLTNYGYYIFHTLKMTKLI